MDARWHLEVLARFINDHRHPLLYNVQFVKQPEHRRALVVSLAGSTQEELFVDYGKRYWTGAGYKPSKLHPSVALTLLTRLDDDQRQPPSPTTPVAPPPPPPQATATTATASPPPLAALSFVSRFACRGTSHRCAYCAAAAESGAAAATAVELLLTAGHCSPLDLVEGKVDLPPLPKLDGESEGSGSGSRSRGGRSVACSGGCGEVFCSEGCERAFNGVGGHQLMCVGPLESLEHPLVQFRRFCFLLEAGGEELLLAAHPDHGALQGDGR